jgi:uncharacterized protein
MGHSTAPQSAPDDASPIRRWICEHPLSTFVGMAFGLTWTYDIALGWFLGLSEAPFGTLPRDLGPTAAALVVVASVHGRPGVHAIARSLRAWRLSPYWYGITLIGIPLTYLLGVSVVVHPGEPTMPPVSILAAYPILILLAAVAGGPLLEEPGWRGLAQPTLQQRVGALPAAVVVGLMWAAWHATGYLDDGFAQSNGGRGLPAVATFVGAAIAVSVVIAWVYNATGGSLLMAVLAHNSVNVTQATAGDVWPGVQTEVGALAGFSLLAITIVVATRGRLGWRESTRSI